MKLGKRIKSLRLQKSMTQEKLAEHFNLSAQAISKWENDITTPDIGLLPDLSAFFGVTIDELFQVSDDTHFDRIESMIEDVRDLSKEEFDYAKKFLTEKLDDADNRGKTLRLLAEINLHKVDSLRREAEYFAKEALKEEPKFKENHTALCRAQNGTFKDWNYVNHQERIAYYKSFVKEHPDYARGYMWLIDELIVDGRLEEAEEAIGKMKQVDNDFRVRLYEGEVAWEKGQHEEAYKIWNKMIASEPDNWLVYASVADKYSFAGEFDKAIEYNKKAYNLQPSPKYTDAHECIAHIYEITGEKEKAIRAWEDYIRTLEKEWQIIEGELFDKAHREIKRLR